MAEHAADASSEVVPDPAEIRSLDEVAGYLRYLRAWAGQVSYPELVRRINRRRDPRAQARQTTVYDCFRRGRRRLDPDLVLEIAAALGLDGPGRSRLRRAITVAHQEADGIAVAGLHVSVPRQLPAPPQTFTGRAAELADLDRAHEASTMVITAIDGMAGIGKTALAVHAAHQIADRFPDGQLFVDLHGYTQGVTPVEPGEALDRLLRTLGVAGERIPADLDERAGLYRSRLADQKVLIVLDDAAAEAQVAPLLPGAAGCLVLVTSRRRLAGLDHTHTVSLNTLPPPDAVTLFTRTVGEERLIDQSPEVVAETVELCGRLPLAIRIAAARLRSHPTWNIGHLVERLRDHQHRLGELEAGQRSVTAALDLSYQHLTPDEQRAYRRLGLHPGPDIEPYAATALLDTTPVPADRLLDQLLEAHLLQEPTPGRYVFHDLTRDHATHTATAVDAEPDRRAALTRLFDHYRHTAAAAMDTAHPYEHEHRPLVPPAGTPTPDLSGPTQANAWLDTELPNLLAAARHTAEHGGPEHIWHLSATLHRHLRTRGRYTDAETLHHQALNTARVNGNRAGQLDALNGLGDVHWMKGRYVQAAERFGQALEIARSIGNRTGELDALYGLGEVHWLQGRHGQALDHFGQALEIARTAGSRTGGLNALLGGGSVHQMQGRYGQAIDHYRQALEIARSIGNRTGERNALNGLGQVHRMRGRYGQAIDHFGQALEIARSIGNRSGELDALTGLGHLHRLQGRHGQAIDHHRQALEIAHSTGNRTGELNALLGLGWVNRLRGRYQQAVDHYHQVLDIAREIGNRNWQFEALHGLGRLHYATGDPDLALAYYRQAFELATDLAQPADQARAHDGLAHAHHDLNQPEQARQHWQHALDILTSLGTDHTEDEEANVPTIRTHLANLDQQRDPRGRLDPDG